MLLGFVFAESRSEEKRVSRLSITRSLLPPLSGLSYSASARKPFLNSPGGGAGWGVKLPNNSPPLSIMPLPLRSRASHASSAAAAVHDKFSLTPSLSRSNRTPPLASVRSNPFPKTSSKIGVGSHPPTPDPSRLVAAQGSPPPPPPTSGPASSSHVVVRLCW